MHDLGWIDEAWARVLARMLYSIPEFASREEIGAECQILRDLPCDLYSNNIYSSTIRAPKAECRGVGSDNTDIMVGQRNKVVGQTLSYNQRRLNSEDALWPRCALGLHLETSTSLVNNGT